MAEEADEEEDVEQGPSAEVALPQVTTTTYQGYHAIGTESEDSDDEGEEKIKTPEAINKIVIQMAVLNERLKDLDLDSEDEAHNVEGCLGTKEDRAYLGAMVKRFAKDDLADAGDGVQAAVRMHIQTVSQWKKWIYCIFTCGLWIFFRSSPDMFAS
eukprot:g2042.t1